MGLAGCANLLGFAGHKSAQPMGQAPMGGAELCARSASLDNPMAAAPGVGGTGAPRELAQQLQAPGGIGGTGQVAQRPGLGGTGSPDLAQRGEGGIGGTGIVGVVTGFASICVNGVKVEYTPQTPVLRDGAAVPLSVLAVGQVVALQASGEGDWLQADRIAVLDAAVGPLTQVDAASGHFTVMGQVAVALAQEDLAGLRAGDWVRVSGHRLADGHIRASRVQRTEPGVARIAGAVTGLDAGGLRIGSTPVTLGGVPRPAELQPGQEVSVAGVWTGEQLQATVFQAQPTRAALGPVRNLLLQGYVQAVPGQDLSVGGESFTFNRALKVLGGTLESLRSGQAVLVRGRLDEQQRLVVDRLEFRPEGGNGRGSTGRSNSGTSSSSSSGSGDSSGTSGSKSGGSDSIGQGRGRGRGRSSD